MRSIIALTVERYLRRVVEVEIPQRLEEQKALWRVMHRDFLERSPFPLWRLLGVRSGRPSKTALTHELERATVAHEGARHGEYLERRAREKIRRAFKMLQGKSKRQWRKWWKIRVD